MFDVNTLQRIALRLGSETKRGHDDARCTADSERSGDSWGKPVFANTRVPIQTLLEYLEAGEGPDRFLEEFTSVSREQTIAVLEAAREGLGGSARPSRGVPSAEPRPRTW
jgi:uncharacterized protein (DUF433 family)